MFPPALHGNRPKTACSGVLLDKDEGVTAVVCNDAQTSHKSQWAVLNHSSNSLRCRKPYRNPRRCMAAASEAVREGGRRRGFQEAMTQCALRCVALRCVPHRGGRICSRQETKKEGEIEYTYRKRVMRSVQLNLLRVSQMLSLERSAVGRAGQC